MSAAPGESTQRRAPLPSSGQVEGYLRLARGRRQAGGLQLALDILETARTLTPGGAELLCEIARTHAAAGATDLALATYEAAAREYPDCLDAHWERGVLLEGRGQIDAALEAWRLSDLTRDAARHSMYLVAALKSPRSTNESLLEAQQEWVRHHARAQS